MHDRVSFDFYVKFRIFSFKNTSTGLPEDLNNQLISPVSLFKKFQSLKFCSSKKLQFLKIMLLGRLRMANITVFKQQCQGPSEMSDDQQGPSEMSDDQQGILIVITVRRC